MEASTTRVTQGSMPQQSSLRRALLGIPFLILAALGARTLFAYDLPLEELNTAAKTGVFTMDGTNGTFSTTVFGMKPIDETFLPGAIIMRPSTRGTDPIAWWHMLSFLLHWGTVHAIMLVEGTRVSSSMSPARFPNIWVFMMQFLTGAIIVPVYCFTHWVFEPVRTRTTRQQRQSSYIYGILPAMLIGHYSLVLLAHCSPSLDTRHAAILLWQPFPIYISILYLLFSYLLPTRITKYEVRSWDVASFTLSIMAVLTGASWTYTFFNAPFSMATIFLPPEIMQVLTGFMHFDLTFTSIIRRLLQWDAVFSFGPVFLWLIYLHADLRTAGMSGLSWTVLLGRALIATLLLGPALGVTILWLDREDMLLANDSSLVNPEKEI